MSDYPADKWKDVFVVMTDGGKWMTRHRKYILLEADIDKYITGLLENDIPLEQSQQLGLHNWITPIPMIAPDQPVTRSSVRELPDQPDLQASPTFTPHTVRTL